MNEATAREIAIRILDEFEELLAARGIVVLSDGRQCREEEACCMARSITNWRMRWRGRFARLFPWPWSSSFAYACSRCGARWDMWIKNSKGKGRYHASAIA